jgi:hypothetical protein
MSELSRIYDMTKCSGLVKRPVGEEANVYLASRDFKTACVSSHFSLQKITPADSPGSLLRTLTYSGLHTFCV